MSWVNKYLNAQLGVVLCFYGNQWCLNALNKLFWNALIVTLVADRKLSIFMLIEVMLKFKMNIEIQANIAKNFLDSWCCDKWNYLN